MTLQWISAHAIDPDQAGTLHTLCFEAMGERGWSAREMAELLSNPSVFAFGMGENGDLIGLVLVQQIISDAEILTICVSSSRQRGGLGRKLMEKTISRLENMNVSSLFLECAADNYPAQQLYASLGFEKCGVRKKYYARKNGNRVDAHLLRKNL